MLTQSWRHCRTGRPEELAESRLVSMCRTFKVVVLGISATIGASRLYALVKS